MLNHLHSSKFEHSPEITHLDIFSIDAGEAGNIFSRSFRASSEKNVGGEGVLHGGCRKVFYWSLPITYTVKLYYGSKKWWGLRFIAPLSFVSKIINRVKAKAMHQPH